MEGLAAAIREMSARLAAIETGLDADRRAGTRPLASTSSSLNLPEHPPLTLPNGQPEQARGATASTAPSRSEPVDMPVESNPLQMLVSTMEQMSRDEAIDADEPAAMMVTEPSAADADPNGLGEADAAYEEHLARLARNEPRSERPDAFARGLVTLEDVQTAFAFYTQRIQPWIPVIERRGPLVVRDRSPFLFHVILLVTNYYNTSTSDRAREVYAGLTRLVHELLVSHILAPDPSMFTRDMIRALLLLLYYKPVETAAYTNRGVKSMGRIVHASKVNALSSLMIHSLVQRAASFIAIQESPRLLTPVLDHPDLASPADRKRALAEFRLWCTLVAADALGSLQSGRSTWTDPTAALKITRRFAALAADPTDVRRAAILELYSIVTVPTSAPAATHPVRYRLEHIVRINAQLDSWKAYWTPILAEAQKRGDPLAYTVVQTLAQFVILSVNGAVFTRWDLDRKKELEEGKEGRPKLTNNDWQHLQRAAEAADAAIFIVSTEATATGHPLREYVWPAPVNGYRAALHVDPRITEDFKTALDTMTCIAFVYSLLFLVRMASAGLVTCDLQIRKSEYAGGCDLSAPQPLATGQKLPRLLELGAAFLNGIAPNPDHPARRHALLVEMILRVGLSATTPQASAGSPASSAPRQSPGASSLSAHPQFSHPLPDRANGSSAANGQPSVTYLPSPSATTGRPPAASFDSWLWDTTTPTTGTVSGPLRMQDGSFVMPDLTISSSAGGAPPSTAAPLPPSLNAPFGSGSRASTSAMDATATAASAGRKGDAAQAMASLLSEVNPFLDDFYATQPAIGSHAFNDDFGLGLGSLTADAGGLSNLEWAALGSPDPNSVASLGIGAVPGETPVVTPNWQ